MTISLGSSALLPDRMGDGCACGCGRKRSDQRRHTGRAPEGERVPMLLPPRSMCTATRSNAPWLA